MTAYRRFYIVLATLLLLAPPSFAEEVMHFTKDDRLLIVAPHPDDEILSLGGLIQTAKKAGASVKVVYLTNGESNEIAALFYQKRPLLLRSDFIKSGLTRKKEAKDGIGVLGAAPEDAIFLGYPDGGLMNIWFKYWGGAKSFRSLFTRINKVPFHDDPTFGHPYRGESVVHDLENVIREAHPTHVFVTAPFDLNSDHQAAYLFLQVALLNLAATPEGPRPEARLYLIHAHRWPMPKEYVPYELLPVPSRIQFGDAVRWYSHRLKPEEIEKKKEALLKHKSQIAYKKKFLLSFVRANERTADYLPQTIGSGETLKAGVMYRVSEKELSLEIPLTSDVDELGALSSYVFGYRGDTPFESMPKLSFKLFGNKVFVADGFRELPPSSIFHTLEEGRLRIRIPLSLLKDPDHLFVSTRTTKEKPSLDFSSWKMLEVV